MADPIAILGAAPRTAADDPQANAFAAHLDAIADVLKAWVEACLGEAQHTVDSCMYDHAQWVEDVVQGPLLQIQELHESFEHMIEKLNTIKAYMGLQDGAQPLVLYNGVAYLTCAQVPSSIHRAVAVPVKESILGMEMGQPMEGVEGGAMVEDREVKAGDSGQNRKENDGEGQEAPKSVVDEAKGGVVARADTTANPHVTQRVDEAEGIASTGGDSAHIAEVEVLQEGEVEGEVGPMDVEGSINRATKPVEGDAKAPTNQAANFGHASGPKAAANAPAPPIPAASPIQIIPATLQDPPENTQESLTLPLCSIFALIPIVKAEK
jgi:hypothetical protein